MMLLLTYDDRETNKTTQKNTETRQNYGRHFMQLQSRTAGKCHYVERKEVGCVSEGEK